MIFQKIVKMNPFGSNLENLKLFPQGPLEELAELRNYIQSERYALSDHTYQQNLKNQAELRESLKEHLQTSVLNF